MFNEVLNDRNFNDLMKQYCAPSIQGKHESMSPASGFEDLQENIRTLLKNCPDYRQEVVSTSARVSERNGTATVWIVQMITGLPDGMWRESVSVLSWERRNSKWVCMSHKGLRGLPFGGELAGPSSEASNEAPTSQ